MSCCSCSVVTILGAGTAISRDKLFVFLRQYFPKYVCSVHYGCFLYFLYFVLPGMLFRYFLKYFEVDPVAPVTSGTNFVVTCHMRCISVVRPLFFKISSASVLNTLLSPETATSFNVHVPFSFSLFTMSGLLLGMVLRVCTRCLHNTVTLASRLVSTNFGTCSYQCSLSNFISISLHTLNCR